MRERTENWIWAFIGLIIAVFMAGLIFDVVQAVVFVISCVVAFMALAAVAWVVYMKYKEDNESR